MNRVFFLDEGGELIFEPVPIIKTARIPIKLTALEMREGLETALLDSSPHSWKNRAQSQMSGSVSLSLDHSPFSYLCRIKDVPIMPPLSTARRGILEMPRSKIDLSEALPAVNVHCRFVHRMR